MEIIKRLVLCILVLLMFVSACSHGKELLTEQGSPLTTMADSVEENVSFLKGKIIVIDAGHGINSSKRQEIIAPDATQTKPAFVSGTRGKNQTEEELNLKISFKMKKSLEELGAHVYMTREEHTTEMSNIDRAEFANDLNADLCVKLHADGNNDKTVRGASVLVPGGQYITDSEMLAKSRRAGECVLEAFVAETGAVSRGIFVRNDMTGFNWSKVPVILIEMGFMSNAEDDSAMEVDDYQNKMVCGIVTGIENYFADE